MFTDMVGYSALTQRNEGLALELLDEHRRILRKLFPEFAGREVETTGDGFLVEFASALEACRCAIDIQRCIATRNLNVSPDRQIQLRIGVHVGDIIYREGQVLGDGVNIAARVQPLATPGGICISVDVARQVQNNLALVQCALKKCEAALDSLEKAFDENATGLANVNVDPLWKELRAHPRVQTVLRRMNLLQ
jgi:class 3 adenylate cyclase